MGVLEGYLAGLDEPVRAVFSRVRALALEVVPEAEEGTGYGMPGLVLGGKPLLAVQAARKHLSLYPFSAQVVEDVRDRLVGYDVSKGTIRFSAEHPLPDDIVREVVRRRAAEILGPR